MSISALSAGMPPPLPAYDAQMARSRAVEGAAAGTAVSRPTDTEEAASPQAPNVNEVRQALEEIETALAPVAQALEFSIDDDSGKTVVKVMDSLTNEVIRQMPSEEVLAISKALDKLKGLLLRQQA